MSLIQSLPCTCPLYKTYHIGFLFTKLSTYTSLPQKTHPIPLPDTKRTTYICVPHTKRTTYMPFIQNVPNTQPLHKTYHIPVPHTRRTIYMPLIQNLPHPRASYKTCHIHVNLPNTLPSCKLSTYLSFIKNVPHTCPSLIQNIPYTRPSCKLNTYTFFIQNLPQINPSHKTYHIHGPHIKCTTYMFLI